MTSDGPFTIYADSNSSNRAISSNCTATYDPAGWPRLANAGRWRRSGLRGSVKSNGGSSRNCALQIGTSPSKKLAGFFWTAVSPVVACACAGVLMLAGAVVIYRVR